MATTTVTDDPDRERGLYRKYEVRKVVPYTDQRGELTTQLVDPGPVFVLAYTKDPHARAALSAYADSCAAEYPYLAADLRALLNEES